MAALMCETKLALCHSLTLALLQESAVWVGKRQALKATGVNSNLSLIKLWTLSKLYWHRLIGTALSWFVWDFAFYGNKLFQFVFISIIVPQASLKTTLEWTLLNSTVALVGYYFAAFTVDRAWMGRRKMQVRLCAVIWPVTAGVLAN